MRKRISVLLVLTMMLISVSVCSADSTGTMVSGRLNSWVESAEDLALKQILADAENRKQGILNAKTTITKSDTFIKGETYSGTAYYISNSGSDQNDGLSPETAFATIEPLNRIALEYGDAIFFERGSIWRAFELPPAICKEAGITYSAYGEGDKPKFYGSEENGSGADKWELHYEDGTGKKIWVYYRDMTEVGSIALEGKIPVKRDIAYWDDGSYYYMDEGSLQRGCYLETGKIYSVEEHLPDMRCFPALVYSDSAGENWNDDIHTHYDWSNGTAEYALGKLYMRCDAGNPGELYDSIEFMQPYAFSIYAGAKDCVFDNLCIGYSCYTFGTENDGWTIQNCEFGWMGGGVCNYRSVLEKEYADANLGLNYELFGRRGGAVSLNNPLSTAKGNYVHHAFQEGISVEIFDGDAGAYGIMICDNLIEKCNQPLLLCNWDAEIDPNHNFRNITIENNYILHTGVDSLYNTEWEKEGNAAFTIQGGPNYHNGTVYVKNNVFALSENPLIVLPQLNDYMKVFEGNTYVQKKNAPGIFVGWEATYPLTGNVAALLGDESGRIILVE